MGGKLRVRPALEGKEQLMHAKLPMEVTFEGRGDYKPNPKQDTPVAIRDPAEQKPVVLNVKRLDVILHKAAQPEHHPKDDQNVEAAEDDAKAPKDDQKVEAPKDDQKVEAPKDDQKVVGNMEASGD